MGKGSRNRFNRDATPKKAPNKKVKAYRKPLPKAAKITITAVVCVALLTAIVIGQLASFGTFKRSNILVHSKDGSFDLNQQMATYMVWDALYYTGYYQWSYLSPNDKTQLKAQGITTQAQYCLYYAMTGVQNTLKTSIEGYANTLKEYVAVCDFAKSLDVTLSKEEIKQAKNEAEAQINYMAMMNGMNIKGFLNLYVGNNVKLGDVQDVAVIQALYKKMVDKKEKEVTDHLDGTGNDDLIIKFRDDNPESFYSTDYLVYSTENKDLKDKLLAAKGDVKKFKTVLLEETFNENYKSVYNKYATDLHTQAENVLTAIKGKTNPTDLAAAVAGQGMEIKEYTADDLKAMNESLKNWVFDKARAAYDANTVATADKLYVVVLSTAPAENKVNAAIKEIAFETGDSYDGDANFKQNIFNTVLVKLELLTKTEGMKLYTDSTEKNIKGIVDDLETILDKAMPKAKTQNYISELADTDKDSYKDWMFDKDTLKSPVAVGDVKEFSETKDNVTTYTVYMIEDPMKLDTDPQIDGGYIKFESTKDKKHDVLAQEFMDSIKNLKGEELSKKFAENQKAVITKTISKAAVSDKLADWLFADERKKDDVGMITLPNTAEKEGEDNSCTYVAFYNGSNLTWKNSARSGYIQDQLTQWVKGLVESYELDGMNKIKDQMPIVTGTETTAVTTAKEAVTA